MPYKRGAPKGNRNRRTHGYYSQGARTRRRELDKHIRALLVAERAAVSLLQVIGQLEATAPPEEAAAAKRRLLARLEQSQKLADRHDHQRDGRE